MMTEIWGMTPGSARIAKENFPVRGQGVNPFLDAGAARVVQTDDRCAILISQVHQLGDLSTVGFAQ